MNSYYFIVILIVVIGITSNAFRLSSLSSSSSLSLSSSSIYMLNQKRRYIQKYNSNQQFINTISSSSSSSSSRLKSLQLKMGLIDGIKKSLVGSSSPTEVLTNENDKLMKKYLTAVEKINALETEYEGMSNDALQSTTTELKKKVKGGASLDSVLVEAFALVREAAWRVLQMRHYDVQLIGGMALHDCRLAEMATGEGKTLVALLPVFLNALSGQSAYVVTTNDYLARRDGETMGQVFRFLGMKVGIIQTYLKEVQRKEQYSSDIVYVSNQELGFDFLRDNLAMSSENIVQQKPFNFCVVDEADSILIDEARTPLIISRKGAVPTTKYVSCAEIVKNLNAGEHYEVNKKDQKVELTKAGYKFAEQIVGKSLFDLADPWAFYIINALKAKELFTKDQEYIVKGEGDAREIAIVDTFSGRVLEGRRFTDGLQQSIEAKEKLKVSGETQVVAKVTYQNLFRLFPRLSGMTGTAFTEAAEFIDVYGLKVIPIPTALPVARRDNADAIFRTKEGKLKAMLKNVLTTHEKGRPVLIGTTSVESSEEISQALKDLEIPCKVLNARPENVERESEIVSQAGRLGAVTVATNMAGRGTDILLGGSSKGVAKVLAKHLMLMKLGLGPLPSDELVADVIAARVPEEKASSEGEEKDPAEVETDEDVLSLPPLDAVARQLDLWMPHQLKAITELNLKRAVISCIDEIGASANRLDVEDIIAQAGDSAPTKEPAVRLLRAALNAVAKEFDEVIKAEREKVKRLGGLYVVGTSRHESRRIDNQLRGRAGRQGDQGGTRFFLSLEDDMFKLFGGDKMKSLLENFRVAEDMPIENDLVDQALEKVQIQVEEYSRGTRQQVFMLDEVTANQRTSIYAKRRSFLTDSEEEMLKTFRGYCEKTLVEIYESSLPKDAKGNKVTGGPVKADKLVSKAIQFFPNIVLTQDDITKTSPEKVQKLVSERLELALAQKIQLIDTVSPWAFAAFFRYLALVQTDESWCKHLSRLELLKEEMVLASFTPDGNVMDTYREKAAKIFETLGDDIRRNTVYSLFIYQPNTSKT